MFLLGRCSHELVGEAAEPLTVARRATILASNEELAGEALRTLGVAFRSLPKDAFTTEEADERVEHSLVFLGLVGMMDPPHEEAKSAVARAKGAGIRLIMITGDHSRTASVTAAELGIVGEKRAVTGSELDRIPQEALAQRVHEISVYARVNPAHKLRLVRALQRGGATVAMTGDGVNDAPALKTADTALRWALPGPMFRGKPPTWCWLTITSPGLSQPSRRGVRSFPISESSCATCCRRTSGR